MYSKSSRRIFANNFDLNFSEYINQTKAESIFKNLINNNSKTHRMMGIDATLNLQKKYSTWLSEYYAKAMHPVSIIDAKKSFIRYEPPKKHCGCNSMEEPILHCNETRTNFIILNNYKNHLTPNYNNYFSGNRRIRFNKQINLP